MPLFSFIVVGDLGVGLHVCRWEVHALYNIRFAGGYDRCGDGSPIRGAQVWESLCASIRQRINQSLRSGGAGFFGDHFVVLGDGVRGAPLSFVRQHNRRRLGTRRLLLPAR